MVYLLAEIPELTGVVGAIVAEGRYGYRYSYGRGGSAWEPASAGGFDKDFTKILDSGFRRNGGKGKTRMSYRT